ncbi:ubl carboxyl-terminal hydrolase 18 [Scyliorhinus canicula]|uniref:ubl carboxyl-terminal hydrolase 18 n=1 Tax=Scyliorhinus canicula TaxID=7830 RepID=UPI0018F34CE6|nr:ubl carboxyl-terminal hydrolase 18 [Scyliorhinus canicula]
MDRPTPNEKKQGKTGLLDTLDTERSSRDDLPTGQVDNEEGQLQPQSLWLYTSGKFKNGIVGLENQGLTCCINVVLQSFYLTPEFTSILQRLDLKKVVVDPTNVPSAMHRLFEQMQASGRHVKRADTFLCCLARNGVRVNRQHDAEELFLLILNFLLDQLQAPERAKELRSLYEIKLEQFVKCDCGHVTVRDSNFLSLPLPLKKAMYHGHFQLVRSNSNLVSHPKLSCFQVNRQHDAEELFLLILNFLLDQLQAPERAKELRSLYEIKLEQFVKCDCGHVTVRDSNFLSLPLPLKKAMYHGHFQLEEILRKFFEPQELSRGDQRLCPGCERRRSAKQGFNIVALPDILNLQLNRFRAGSSTSFFTEKIYSSVTFPEILNLNHFPISEKVRECGIGQECWQYHLYAVLAHYGSAIFGHYTVYVKSFKDSKWYYMDDSRVCQVRIQLKQDLGKWKTI